MDSSLAKKNTTRFLLYSFVGLLVFSMGVFAMLGVYMSRKSTKTIHEVGEIYMSGTVSYTHLTLPTKSLV